jgi:hypothetical protein
LATAYQIQVDQANETPELTANDISSQTTSGIKTNSQVLPAKSLKNNKIKTTAVSPNAIATYTHSDSVTLNLIELYPGNNHYLFDNTVTRSLHQPVVSSISVDDTISLNTIAINDSLASDSTLKISGYKIEVSKPLLTASNYYLTEKPLPKSHFTAYYPWLVPILLLFVVFTGFIRIISGKYLSNLFSSTIYGYAANSLFKTINVRNTLPSIGLNVLFIMNIALFLFEMSTHFQITPMGLHGIVLFGLITLSTMILAFFKVSIYRFLGYIFNTKLQTSEFLFHVGVFNKVFGIVILPLLLMIPFVSEMAATVLIQIGLVFFILVYIFQLFKGSKIILRESASLIYMFLYLCTLEILPLSILFKLLVR